MLHEEFYIENVKVRLDDRITAFNLSQTAAGKNAIVEQVFQPGKTGGAVLTYTNPANATETRFIPSSMFMHSDDDPSPFLPTRQTTFVVENEHELLGGSYATTVE